MKNAVYLNQLLTKLNRERVRISWFDVLTRYHQVQIHQVHAQVLLELLLAVITRESCICEDDQSLEYLREHFDEVQVFWVGTISRFSIRFSHESAMDGVDWVRIKLLVLVLIKDKDYVEGFFKSLYIEIGQAEYRGVPFDEPKAEIPPSLLPTHERRTFFKPLVPFGTKWKT